MPVSCLRGLLPLACLEASPGRPRRAGSSRGHGTVGPAVQGFLVLANIDAVLPRLHPLSPCPLAQNGNLSLSLSSLTSLFSSEREPRSRSTASTPFCAVVLLQFPSICFLDHPLLPLWNHPIDRLPALVQPILFPHVHLHRHFCATSAVIPSFLSPSVDQFALSTDRLGLSSTRVK